jgi:hypothetical protein
MLEKISAVPDDIIKQVDEEFTALPVESLLLQATKMKRVNPTKTTQRIKRWKRS